MRIARIKIEEDAYYHCMSRVIERRYVLGDTEKEKFRQIMRELETFCGVEILTYAILDNHWHILLQVPERCEVSDQLLLTRLAAIYEPYVVKAVARQLRDLRESGDHAGAEELKAKYTYRMYDVSEYFKTVKQRFSQWYNRRNGRRGTLWEERFKSILIEDSDCALSAVAAYLDLNAVRAGITKTPEDYRYCGYGEAMGGSEKAKAGIQKVMQAVRGSEASWDRIRCWYRKHLYMQGREKGIGPDGKPIRNGFSAEAVEEVLEAGGDLPMSTLLHCRVRYFSDGVALGSQAFIEDIFQQFRDQFGAKRQTGARPMKHGHWNGLCTLRNLRLAPISTS